MEFVVIITSISILFLTADPFFLGGNKIPIEYNFDKFFKQYLDIKKVFKSEIRLPKTPRQKRKEMKIGLS